MKNVSSNLVSVFITSVFILSFIVYFFFYRDVEIVVEISNEQKITEAVSSNFQNQNIEVEKNFKITNISQRYAKGQILINGKLTNVYFILTNNEWKIVYMSEEPINCEKGEKFGFPNNMISDCLYVFPKAKTPEDISKSSSDDLKNQKEIEIIGDIVFGDDPFSGDFQIVGENGDSVTVNYDFDIIGQDNVAGISNSDYVVADIIVTENEEGEIEFILEDIQEVETTYNYENSNGSSNNDQEGNSIDDTDLSEEVYYDITDLPPDAAIDFEEYYRSLIDRDFSDQEIELISDF